MIILQESKFELLFEMAVIAFIDGYYREVVASLAASIERLYEFYIFAVALNRGITEAEILHKLLTETQKKYRMKYEGKHYSIMSVPT